MRDYVYPYIGSRPIAEITNEDIYQLLRLIWMTKEPTASKLRGRIEKVFGFARVRKFYLHSNPAVWVDNLEHLLGKPGKIHRVEHHEAMDIDDIPEFMRHLEERHKSPRSPNSAKALYWVVLSACRYQEAAGATFDEIKGDTWIIPKERMKGGKEHRVPLTTPMLTLLEQLKRERVCDYLFPGMARKDMTFQPRSENTITKYLQALPFIKGKPTTHGMRSTFKVWAMERTNWAL